MNGPRPADDNIPYRDGSVTFIQIQPNKTIASSNEVGIKKAWLTESHPLYAAWNGRHRTDMFEVDLKAARKRERP